MPVLAQPVAPPPIKSFVLRQLAERKDFEQSIQDKSYWARRKLTNEFNAEQAAQKKAYNDAPAMPVPAQPVLPPPVVATQQPTAPANNDLGAQQPVVPPLIMAAQQPTAPANNDLRTQIQSEERHFKDQATENRFAFEQRQVGGHKDFEQSINGKPFWEKRKLTNEFNTQQAVKKNAFNAEQEKKRRMYEWRYP